MAPVHDQRVSIYCVLLFLQKLDYSNQVISESERSRGLRAYTSSEFLQIHPGNPVTHNEIDITTFIVETAVYLIIEAKISSPNPTRESIFGSMLNCIISLRSNIGFFFSAHPISI